MTNERWIFKDYLHVVLGALIGYAFFLASLNINLINYSRLSGLAWNWSVYTILIIAIIIIKKELIFKRTGVNNFIVVLFTAFIIGYFLEIYTSIFETVCFLVKGLMFLWWIYIIEKNYFF